MKSHMDYNSNCSPCIQPPWNLAYTLQPKRLRKHKSVHIIHNLKPFNHSPLTKDKVQIPFQVSSIIWLLYNSPVLSLPVHSSNAMLHLWQTDFHVWNTLYFAHAAPSTWRPLTIFQDSAFLWSLLWTTNTIQNTGPFHSLTTPLFHNSINAPIKIYNIYLHIFLPHVKTKKLPEDRDRVNQFWISSDEHNGWNTVDGQYSLNKLKSLPLTFLSIIILSHGLRGSRI